MIAPFVPAEVDLRNFAYTPIFRSRLFGSEFHAHATDAGWRAGVTLWLKSWDQVPAGSLPDNDVELCRLAELARDMRAWKKVKADAMHGWVLCSDGRLYHPVVAQGVNEAWSRKLRQQQRTQAARDAKRQRSVTSSVTEAVTDDVTRSVLSIPFHSPSILYDPDRRDYEKIEDLSSEEFNLSGEGEQGAEIVELRPAVKGGVR